MLLSELLVICRQEHVILLRPKRGYIFKLHGRGTQTSDSFSKEHICDTMTNSDTNMVKSCGGFAVEIGQKCGRYAVKSEFLP